MNKKTVLAISLAVSALCTLQASESHASEVERSYYCYNDNGTYSFTVDTTEDSLVINSVTRSDFNEKYEDKATKVIRVVEASKTTVFVTPLSTYEFKYKSFKTRTLRTVSSLFKDPKPTYYECEIID